MKTIRSSALSLAFITLLTGFGNAQASTTLLYVANSYASDLNDLGKITAFDPASNGPSSPVLTITQPSGAWSLAFDSSLHLYSKYFLSSAPILVYAPNASGNATPIHTAYGGHRDATGIAVDSKGYIYVATGTQTGTTYLEVHAPNTTLPFKKIPLYAYTDGVTVDKDDNVIVTAWSRYTPAGEPIFPQPNVALLVFAPRLEGDTPIRVITGTNTKLSPWLSDSGHTGFKLSYSKLTGRLYAGMSGGTPESSKVLVFDSHANGNAAPIRTISGPATGLRSFIHGVAGNPVTGEIFVLSRESRQPGIITVYSQLANGNTAPLRSFTDLSSQFTDSMDIAFSPPPSLLLNAGGATTGNFVADSKFNGGGTVVWNEAVDTSLLVGIAPPQGVLKSDREGTFSYTFNGFVPHSSHTITMYFVENYFSAARKRVFNITANNVAVLNNFDVYAEAGTRFKAIQRSITLDADATGTITLRFSATVDQAKVGGIVVN